MYIHDRNFSDAPSEVDEPPIVVTPGRRVAYRPDRGLSGFGGFGQTPAELSAKHLWPKKFIWGAKTFSSSIQASFQRAVHAVSVDPAFSHLPDFRDVPIAIVGLDADGGRPVAGQREMEMYFTGSLAKVAPMYAAFQLRQAANDLAATLDATVNTPVKVFKKLSDTFDDSIAASVPIIRSAPGVKREHMIPKYKTVFDAEMVGGIWRLKFKAGASNFADHLRQMIVPSHNDSAKFCIRALGYSWINGLLQAAGFLRFGFPGSEGIWLAGDYDEKREWPVVVLPSVNDGPVKQVTTCFDMARLFALLHDKSLVRNTAHWATARTGNEEMLTLLGDAVSDGAPSVLTRVPHSFTVMQSKIGVGELKGGSCMNSTRDRCVYSEGAIVKHPSTGRKFAVVFQNLTYLRAHPSWWGDGLKRIVAVIQKTMDDYGH